MASGTIKRIQRDKGFGFIRDTSGQEYFFHRSAVQGSFDSLSEGQRVSFDEEQSPKGPRAGKMQAIQRENRPGILRAQQPSVLRTARAAARLQQRVAIRHAKPSHFLADVGYLKDGRLRPRQAHIGARFAPALD